ncbi:hypothetical protein FKM82_028441 [Ascaphus truei]
MLALAAVVVAGACFLAFSFERAGAKHLGTRDPSTGYRGMALSQGAQERVGVSTPSGFWIPEVMPLGVGTALEPGRIVRSIAEQLQGGTKPGQVGSLQDSDIALSQTWLTGKGRSVLDSWSLAGAETCQSLGSMQPGLQRCPFTMGLVHRALGGGRGSAKEDARWPRWSPAQQDLDFTIQCGQDNVRDNAGGQFCQANPSGLIECFKDASGVPVPGWAAGSQGTH